MWPTSRPLKETTTSSTRSCVLSFQSTMVYYTTKQNQADQRALLFLIPLPKYCFFHLQLKETALIFLRFRVAWCQVRIRTLQTIFYYLAFQYKMCKQTSCCFQKVYICEHFKFPKYDRNVDKSRWMSHFSSSPNMHFLNQSQCNGKKTIHIQLQNPYFFLLKNVHHFFLFFT